LDRVFVCLLNYSLEGDWELKKQKSDGDEGISPPHGITKLGPFEVYTIKERLELSQVISGG
jgi:hypothetical protein